MVDFVSVVDEAVQVAQVELAYTGKVVVVGLDTVQVVETQFDFLGIAVVVNDTVQIAEVEVDYLGTVVVVNDTIQVVEVTLSKASNLAVALVDFSVRDFTDDRDPFIELILLDIPALSEDHVDSPYYYAFTYAIETSAPFRPGYVSVSYDDGVSWDEKRAEYSKQSTVAFVVEETEGLDAEQNTRHLSNPLPGQWDVHSVVQVRLARGELFSATRQEVLTGKNLMWLKGEMRAFCNATELTNLSSVEGKVYALTDWLRRMSGTTASADVVVDDVLIDLTGDFVPVRIPNGDDDVPLLYQARPRFADLTPDVFNTAQTLVGENLRPRNVADFRAVKLTNGDWGITFSRVTRNPNPQIFSERGIIDNETTNVFTVEVMSDGTPSATVKRVLPTVEGTPVAGEPVYEEGDYTDADQVTDFGSTQSTVYFRIAQSGDWIDGNPQLAVGTS